MNAEQSGGHGELREATIEVMDDEIPALQCVNCDLKVPKSDPSGFEKHDCEYVQKFLAPKIRTKEDRSGPSDTGVDR